MGTCALRIRPRLSGARHDAEHRSAGLLIACERSEDGAATEGLSCDFLYGSRDDHQLSTVSFSETSSQAATVLQRLVVAGAVGDGITPAATSRDERAPRREVAKCSLYSAT